MIGKRGEIMSKMIRGILAAAVVVIIIAGVWQWNVYNQKKELRQEALLYFKEEDYTKTIRYLETALKKHSVFATNLNRDMTCYLAESYYQLEEYAEAEEIYDTLIQKNPKESKYYQLKGRCAREAEEYDRAIEIFTEGWEKTENSEFLKNICDIYMEKKEYDKALTFAEDGVKAGGELKQEFMYQKVIIYEKSEDYEAAYQAVQEYCELYPKDQEAQKEMVFLSTRI